MNSVYIETTIPSFYHESRASAEIVAWRAATRRWWDDHRHSYTLVTSDVVLAELERAPPAKAAAGRAMLAGVRQLSRTELVERTAACYIENRLVPRSAPADALHLALSSVHGVSFLLTWNCRHLANANKTRHIEAINVRLGLRSPVVTTPLTLLPE